MLQSALPLALDALMPPLAPVVLLLFLGSGFVVFSAALAAGIAAASRRRTLARQLASGALTVGVVYSVLLIAASLVSRERSLRAGEKKYFCEMDCHLAYSVEPADAPGGGPRAVGVTVRTWFDPSTIASFRGNGPLTPNPRIVYLVDARGRRYSPDRPASALARPLRPGESYATTFLFDVPPEAARLRLFLGDPPGLEGLIVDHENSPFHAKTYFELPATATPSAGSSS